MAFNEGGNKGAWRYQLRDKYGRWVEMGGGVSFEIQLPGVRGISRSTGYFVEMDTPTVAIIEVKDPNAGIAKGKYKIPSKNITSAKAILNTSYVQKTLNKASKPETVGSELLKKIDGYEIHKKKLATIAKMLKEDGRFPVPRQTQSTSWGKDSDISRAAKIDYQKVFDSEPAFKEKYGTFEKFWDTVYGYGNDDRTQSPNDLNQIPQDMKDINRAYALHVLGLDPDGFMTVYRNAVNGKENEKDSAVGYVSTDRELAFDYNSAKENVGSNGRYEIDVKPDEVYGMIGYSKIEDEFALTIGTGVTYQDGRVRRVGDVSPVPITAEWLDKYEENIKRARGETPYRHHSLAGQFDFHEVEDLGDTIDEMFKKFNFTASDIKSMFDKIFGDGAYEKYKASGNTVSFQDIKKMFVKLPSGKVGLDITKIPGGYDGYMTVVGYGDTANPSSFNGDRTDNMLKMLSVIQELTKQPFFTHRSRNYVPTKK